ncbi:hypothetical protein ACIRU5_29625 [Streptomyces misionensis]|uniref:hypothetical protein n=1 Tax=Streptomyces misionensis TaxID=67331 RepID=UPI00381F8483
MATTALARDVLPDDLPYQTGAAGPLGSSAAALLLRECDTLLLVGAEDLDPAVLPDPAGCRIVAVGSGESVPGTAVRVNGDPRAALEALILMLHRATDRGWRTRVEDTVREWRAEGRAKTSRYFGTSVNPRSVVAELPDRAVVVTDSGTALGPAIRGCATACARCCRGISVCPARPCPTPSPPSSRPRNGP